MLDTTEFQCRFLAELRSFDKTPRSEAGMMSFHVCSRRAGRWRSGIRTSPTSLLTLIRRVWSGWT